MIANGPLRHGSEPAPLSDTPFSYPLGRQHQPGRALDPDLDERAPAGARRSEAGRIRLLIANDHLGYGDQIHGTARLFLLWAAHLDPERYKVTVCVMRERSSLARLFEERDIDIVFLGKSRYDPSALHGLCKLVRNRRIDLLHLQSYGATTFGRLASAICGVPCIVHFHDRHRNYPLVQRMSDRVLGRFTDHYLAVSRSAASWWARNCGLPPESIEVLHNCMDPGEFEIPARERIGAERARLGIAPGRTVIGTVTRLFTRKGTEHLVRAAARVLAVHRDCTFVIVGDGPLRRPLRELAAALGIERHLLFTGFLPKVAPVLSTFDIAVISSTEVEAGSPLPVLEAMAMGKPIVTTDVVEVIEHGVNGLTIPPGDVEAMADAILDLLDDPEGARILGDRARRDSARFDVRRYVAELDRIYQAVLSRSGKGAR